MKQRVYKEYYDNGNLKIEIYYLGDKEATEDTISYSYFRWHRADGPSIIHYYENGKIRCKAWYVNNKKHRIDGPSIIEYSENGKIEDEIFYVEDKCLNEEEIRKMKIMIELKKEVEK